MNKREMRTQINDLASEYQERIVVLTGLEKHNRNQLLTILIRLSKIVRLKRQADELAIMHRLAEQELYTLERQQPAWYMQMKALQKEARTLWRNRYDSQTI